ncbi:MAG TPA: hypothetical protein VIJ22_04975, partial [Polyangiaceae bacterium]
MWTGWGSVHITGLLRVAPVGLALVVACASSPPPALVAPGAPAAPPQDVRAAVLAMADAIARDVSRDGPTGWLPYFAHVTGFFWAADGAV